MAKCENLCEIEEERYYCVYMPLKEVDITEYGCLDESGERACPIYKWSVKGRKDANRN